MPAQLGFRSVSLGPRRDLASPGTVPAFSRHSPGEQRLNQRSAAWIAGDETLIQQSAKKQSCQIVKSDARRLVQRSD